MRSKRRRRGSLTRRINSVYFHHIFEAYTEERDLVSFVYRKLGQRQRRSDEDGEKKIASPSSPALLSPRSSRTKTLSFSLRVQNWPEKRRRNDRETVCSEAMVEGREDVINRILSKVNSLYLIISRKDRLSEKKKYHVDRGVPSDNKPSDMRWGR